MSLSTVIVPESVKQSDLLKALEPFFDLLHVTAGEVFNPVVIGGDEITFAVVARGAGDTSEKPAGINLQGAPQEFAELAYWCRVQIVVGT